MAPSELPEAEPTLIGYFPKHVAPRPDRASHLDAAPVQPGHARHPRALARRRRCVEPARRQRRMKAAMSRITCSSTCAGRAYSAGSGAPLPAMNRWFSDGYVLQVAFLRPASART